MNLKHPSKHYLVKFFADPPEVRIKLEVRKVSLGERISINCSVAGSPTPTIMWKRFGESIQTGTLEDCVEAFYF